MLGRLGRWLRVMGVNVEQIVEPRRTPQDAAALLEAARRTGRVVLTRDGKLPTMAGETTGACYLLAGETTDEQFDEVKGFFQLVFKKEDFMSRCAVCNAKGFCTIDRNEARETGQVKDKVLDAVGTFYQCPRGACGKVYWQGPKFNDACSRFEGNFD
mmetsp:Transcript_8012/g.19073  ORF Transcript_8012/g.19073 Transcript_8012/m.19073 type:complete len:157 (-) Transcript_8012:210-680(-)